MISTTDMKFKDVRQRKVADFFAFTGGLRVKAPVIGAPGRCPIAGLTTGRGAPPVGGITGLG